MEINYDERSGHWRYIGVISDNFDEALRFANDYMHGVEASGWSPGTDWGWEFIYEITD